MHLVNEEILDIMFERKTIDSTYHIAKKLNKNFLKFLTSNCLKYELKCC